MITEKEIKVAAKWWTDQLRGTPKMDNGDGFQSALISLVNLQSPTPTPEQCDAFETALVKELIAECADKTWLPLGVDYGPDKELQNALDAAGIKTRYALPIKTMSWIREGSVQVRNGYHAESVELMENQS